MMLEKLFKILKLPEEVCRYKDYCTAFDLKNPECNEEYSDQKIKCYNSKDIDLK